MSQTINTFGQDEVTHLRSQNDQLWKIIEKQRVMIQNLQKDNVRLSAERDGLQDQVNILEKEVTRKQRVASLLISPQTLSEIAEQEDISTPTSETMEIASPMPPPRSPYRALKSDEFHSLDTVVMNQEPDYDFNGRSSPSSPAPNKSRKSPYVSLSPSKSASSLETTRKNSHQSILRSDRSASPSLNHSSTSLHRQQRQDDHPYFNSMANVNIKVVGSNIRPNEKGKEVVSFSISVGSLREDEHFDERWRVEKLYSDFLTLDAKVN